MVGFGYFLGLRQLSVRNTEQRGRAVPAAAGGGQPSSTSASTSSSVDVPDSFSYSLSSSAAHKCRLTTVRPSVSISASTHREAAAESATHTATDDIAYDSAEHGSTSVLPWNFEIYRDVPGYLAVSAFSRGCRCDGGSLAGVAGRVAGPKHYRVRCGCSSSGLHSGVFEWVRSLAAVVTVWQMGKRWSRGEWPGWLRKAMEEDEGWDLMRCVRDSGTG